MPKVQIDFSQVQGFEALPKAKYKCRVDKVEYGQSKTNPDNMQFAWTLIVIEGPKTNSQIFTVTSLAEKALFKLKNIFVAFGLDANTLNELDVDEDTSRLVDPDFSDKIVLATCGDPQEYPVGSGTMRTNCQMIEPFDDSQKFKAGATAKSKSTLR